MAEELNSKSRLSSVCGSTSEGTTQVSRIGKASSSGRAESFIKPKLPWASASTSSHAQETNSSYDANAGGDIRDELPDVGRERNQAAGPDSQDGTCRSPCRRDGDDEELNRRTHLRGVGPTRR